MHNDQLILCVAAHEDGTWFTVIIVPDQGAQVMGPHRTFEEARDQCLDIRRQVMDHGGVEAGLLEREGAVTRRVIPFES